MESSADERSVQKRRECFEREMTEVLLNLRGRYSKYNGKAPEHTGKVLPVEVKPLQKNKWKRPKIEVSKPKQMEFGMEAPQAFQKPGVSPPRTVPVAVKPIPTGKPSKPVVKIARPRRKTAPTKLQTEFIRPKIAVSVDGQPGISKLEFRKFRRPTISVSAADAISVKMTGQAELKTPRIQIPKGKIVLPVTKMISFSAPSVTVPSVTKRVCPLLPQKAFLRPKVSITSLENATWKSTFDLPQMKAVTRPEDGVLRVQLPVMPKLADNGFRAPKVTAVAPKTALDSAFTLPRLRTAAISGIAVPTIRQPAVTKIENKAIPAPKVHIPDAVLDLEGMALKLPSRKAVYPETVVQEVDGLAIPRLEKVKFEAPVISVADGSKATWETAAVLPAIKKAAYPKVVTAIKKPRFPRAQPELSDIPEIQIPAVTTWGQPVAVPQVKPAGYPGVSAEIADQPVVPPIVAKSVCVPKIPVPSNTNAVGKDELENLRHRSWNWPQVEIPEVPRLFCKEIEDVLLDTDMPHIESYPDCPQTPQIQTLCPTVCCKQETVEPVEADSTVKAILEIALAEYRK